MNARTLVLFVVLSTLWIPRASAERDSVTLSNQWRFIKSDAGENADTSQWERVTIPHTWNALDGQNGTAADPGEESGYFRGPVWYARELQIPKRWKTRRVFIRFEAASLVADVYLNGNHLGQHRGGFTAFAYELTNAINFGGKNLLQVKVDNSKFDDVIPLSGDFTVFGGIYRPVHLFSTDATCISPLDYGTSGVYLTQKETNKENAVVQVETKLSSNGAMVDALKLKIDVLNSVGKIISSTQANLRVEPGEEMSAKIPVSISNPHLWNGLKDPYLYQVRVSLVRDGEVIDTVTEPLGLRSVQITGDRGFLLNGEPYLLHGVNRHQERENKGWALSTADHGEDFKIICDMGATAVRLAHYPQSDYVHNWCDRKGLILWQEIPLVERINTSEAFAMNARQQLREMILQGYNHPSIAFWGIYNELNAIWIKLPNPPDAVPLLTSLRDLAHQLDPSRPVVGASWTAESMPIHSVPDWQCLNNYPGWYWGTLQDLTLTIEKAVANYGNPRIAMSEYGAGANPDQHEEGVPKQPQPKGQWHPEEWQTLSHEAYWSQLKDNPHIWGSFVWAMFDFASDKRDEGSRPGINDKGLVSHDRKIKKDAYYFYQANWTEKPMVHVTGSRLTSRKLPVMDVKVYSNCPEVELKINGRSLGKVKPDEMKIAVWKDVNLTIGKNRVKVRARDKNQVVTDSCEWILEK